MELNKETAQKVNRLFKRAIKNPSFGRKFIRLYSHISKISIDDLEQFIQDNGNYLGGLAKTVMAYKQRRLEQEEVILGDRPYAFAFMVNDTIRSGADQINCGKYAGAYQLNCGEVAGCMQKNSGEYSGAYQINCGRGAAGWQNNSGKYSGSYQLLYGYLAGAYQKNIGKYAGIGQEKYNNSELDMEKN